MDATPNIVPKGYRLEETIGTGGFGVVYRAVQEAVGRSVAVKVVLPRLANEPSFVRRFEVEAQVVARLEHPHITPLYDYWRDPEGAYLVMRYFPRGSLKDRLEGGPLALEQAADLLDELAAALAFAHRNGVVHRDIKPSNVLLDEEESAYLTDFGIAKSVARKIERHTDEPTASGSMAGSPDYVAPEQAQGADVGPAADLYSLGVLMREVLAGERPHADGTTIARIVRHLNEPLPDVEDLPESVRDPVNAVLRRATAQEPGDRFPDAPSMAAAFREAIGPYLRAEGRLPSAGPDEAAATAPIPDGPVENPFKGLRAFRAADADDFFGREALVRSLTDRLVAESDDRLLALVGPSGSGKSSVVHAGLIPALREGAVRGSEDWFVADMVPGAHPFDELEVALTRVAVQASPTLREELTRDERGLVRAAQIILPDDDGDLLLAIDQFEEVFTQVENEDERRRFLGLIRAAATDPGSRVRIVLTLRADFYDRPLQVPGFAELLRGRVETVVPMTAEELERAIVAPTRREGIRFEDGLVSRIVNDVHEQPGALPQLQYALTQLFEAREGRTITRQAYERVGGVGGAVAKRAEDLYSEQTRPAREATRQMFLRLVSLGEGTEDTRRRVLRTELRSASSAPNVMDRVVERFATHRLLSLDHDPATREPTVELAHEAILREWSRLGRWLDESRDDVRMQRQLATLAEEWVRSGRDPSFLLRGTRLAQFEAWRRETDIAWTPEEAAFLEASLELRDLNEAEERSRQERAAALQQRSQRFLQALVGVLLVAAVVSGGLGLWANRQRVTAEEQRQAAEAERARAADAEREARVQAGILLAAQAESEAEEGNTDLAILLALEALENYPPLPQSERALANAVTRNHALQDFHGHELGLTSAAWSPDGTLVASTSQHASALLWDPATGEQVAELVNPEGFVRNVFDYPLAVRWSPDGESLYAITGDRFTTGGQDFNLVRWDVGSRERLAFVQVPNEAEPEEGAGNTASAFVYPTGDALDVAPRSGRVASLAGDDTAAVWSADLSDRLFTLEGHSDDVMSVTWSPDERYLATAGYDGTVRIWWGADGRSRHVLEGHEGAVRTAVWSSDGTELATAGSDGTVRIWSAESGDAVQTIDVRAEGVRSLVWPPEGRHLVVALQDNDVYLASLDTGELESTLSGHRRDVIDIALAPDGERFVSASRDGSARVWSTLPATTVYAFPYSSQGEAGWSPDGSLLAIPTMNFVQGVDFTGVVSLWDAETGEMHTENLEDTPFNLFFESTFSPDGSMIFARGLTSWPDGFLAGEGAIILDAETGELITEVRSSDGTFLREGDWSPDGRHVAIASIEGLIEIVDTDTWEPVRSFVHGDASFVNMVNFSPDGEILSSVGVDGIVRLWDPETGEELRAFGPDPAAETVTAAWSPDGARLVTNSGGAEGTTGTFGHSHVWDPSTGELLVRFDGHEGDLIGVSWSPDGTRIVSIGTDNFARVWDAQTGDEIASIPTYVDFGAPAIWSRDGGLIMVGSDGRPAARVVEFWQSREELIDYARACCVFRELTDAEREEFALDLIEGP